MAWLQKRGKVWWVGYRRNGQQVRRSTKCTSREAAEQALAKLETMERARQAGTLTEEFFQLVTGKAVESSTLDKFLQQWLERAELNVGESTQVKYRQVVRDFGESVRRTAPGLLLKDLTSEHVADFLAQKQGQSLPSTVRGFRRILSSIFIEARNRGYLRANPVAAARVADRKQTEANERRPFTLAEVRDLYSRADAFWKFMILAAFFTGQSLGDLITLQAANVDLAENVVRITRRKTGKRVIIPLAKPLRELLEPIWPKGSNAFFWPEQAGRYLQTGATSFSQEIRAISYS